MAYWHRGPFEGWMATKSSGRLFIAALAGALCGYSWHAQQRETTRRIGAIMLLADDDSEQKVRFGATPAIGLRLKPGRCRQL